MIRLIGLILIFILPVFAGFSKEKENPVKYVNPFIGTGRSLVASKWDGYGGTYPGAVAPYGFVQLSPETRAESGYYFEDDSIRFFSCIEHKSGYPAGSHGRIFVMPVNNETQYNINKNGRPFSHNKEHASPGYYNVLFTDDNTLVEATASEHTGMFRFTFKPSVVPRIFIGDLGGIAELNKNTIRSENWNTIIKISEEFELNNKIVEGNILSFSKAEKGETVILLKISTSQVGHENTKRNIEVENNGWDFDLLRKQSEQKWENELDVIEIEGSNEENKSIFYTALYHSLIIPWIISDVDGYYRAEDGRVYQTNGTNQYGFFSAWDTFRSLHPLLCLIAPKRQNDMILSMLDIYKHSGLLPTDLMTGNHSVPIIVDSYLKGITDFDTTLAYQAMKNSLFGPKYQFADMKEYNELGFVPFSFPESVTRTVEYAYDDWALAQFSKLIAHNNSDYSFLLERSFNYRNLFQPDELFLLPRNDESFKLKPGEFGYKEGDKWIYSLFVPHNPRDIINLTGGDKAFTDHLDFALANNHIGFDNEPSFHIPYLYNYAGFPYKTQETLKNIRAHFTSVSGGLPGNDDLGSMSSWFIFNAMGFYPVCPGKPTYDIGTPLFETMKINLDDNKKLVIKAPNISDDNFYIRKILLNGKEHQKSWISHRSIANGGEIIFEMDSVPNLLWASDISKRAVSEIQKTPEFEISKVAVSKEKLYPNEKFYVHFNIRNDGSLGTKKVNLFLNRELFKSKNILLEENTSRKDSFECRLYQPGISKLTVNSNPTICEVQLVNNGLKNQFKYSQLSVVPILRRGATQQILFSVKNIGGSIDTAFVKYLLNKEVIFTDQININPGETKIGKHSFITKNPGINTIQVTQLTGDYKVYSNQLESTIIDLSMKNINDDNFIEDQSGLKNNGYVISTELTGTKKSQSFEFGKKQYIEIAGANDNIETSETTIMAWVYPEVQNNSLISVITKGDNNVMQLNGNSHLTFFVGGWGRGECRVKLPDDWTKN